MTTDHLPEQATVCIVGCGPAGAMLGLLLARDGISVVVLEKYPDFHRDFRGDPSPAQALYSHEDDVILGMADRAPPRRPDHHAAPGVVRHH